MLNIIDGADSQLRMLDNRKDIKANEKPFYLSEKGLSSEDKITLNSNPQKPVTYNVSGKTEVTESNFTVLCDLVINLLKQQGITTQIASGQIASGDMTTINLEDISPEQAQELIS